MFPGAAATVGAEQRLCVLRASPLRKQGKAYPAEGRRGREPLCVRWLKPLHERGCFRARQEVDQAGFPPACLEKCSGHPRILSRGGVIRMTRSKKIGLEIDSQRDRLLPLGSEL